MFGNVRSSWMFRKYMYLKYVRQLENAKYFCKNVILCAQPTAETHSHLLKKNEITPGLTLDVYLNRRLKLMDTIHKSSFKSYDAHLIVIPSNSVMYMSENIPYKFRQNTDFLYMSGYKEPNSVLLMTTKSDKCGPEHESILFIPKSTAHSERWEGVKMDLPTVTNFLGIHKAMYLDDLEKFLDSFARLHQNFTLWYDYLNSPGPFIHQSMRDFMIVYRNKMTVESPRSFLHQMRLIKSNPEIKLMRKTCQIGAEAMAEVIKFFKPGTLESHLHAKMDYECRIRGADYLSFPPVVAGGGRANTIHYCDNNQIINDCDMVLMDSGCEYHGYCSDLARTWPVNGKFTNPQMELYEIVLAVQEEIIEMCKTKPSLDYLFTVMCKMLGKSLQEVGIINANATERETVEAAYEFCPHHISHYLGMDVHDTNLISRNIKLQPGMVVTVEPGIYISEKNTKVPECYRGICIRIEDDILITDDGFEILTSACPKHVKDIENLIKS